MKLAEINASAGSYSGYTAINNSSMGSGHQNIIPSMNYLQDPNKTFAYLVVSPCGGRNCYKLGDANSAQDRIDDYSTYNPCLSAAYELAGPYSGKDLEKLYFNGNQFLEQFKKTEWYCGDLNVPGLLEMLKQAKMSITRKIDVL